MPDLFTPIIQKLQDIGALNFLFPYILTSAIFYGLLRKSKIFGDPETNVAVNGVVALVAAFMVLAYPIVSGVSLEGLFPPFFMQSLVALLVFMIALMIAGMFLPEDLPKHLAENVFKGNMGLAIVFVGVIIGILILFLSGLSDVLLGPDFFVEISPDLINTIVIILLLLVPFLIVFWGPRAPAPKPVPTPPKPEGEK